MIGKCATNSHDAVEWRQSQHDNDQGSL